MEALLQQGRYQDALQYFQAVEIECEEQILLGGNPLAQLQQNNDFYGLYMITLLLVRNLNEAKYLWKRAPGDVKVSGGMSQLPSVWEIGRAMWQSNAYLALQVISAVSWCQALQGAVGLLRSSIIETELRLLGKCIKGLSVREIESRLGLQLEEINRILQSLGWEQDASGIITPRPLAAADPAAADTLQADLREIQQLAAVVAYNAQKPLKVKSLFAHEQGDK